MPLDVQSLREKGVKVDVPFFDGTPVVVVYDPIRVASPEFRTEYNRKRKELQQTISDWIASLAPAETDDDDAPAEKPVDADDDLALSKRIWHMRGELVEMLLKDWEIEDGGKHLAVAADVFLDGTLPPELADAITTAVWSDVRSLGNPNGSSSTK